MFALWLTVILASAVAVLGAGVLLLEYLDRCEDEQERLACARLGYLAWREEQERIDEVVEQRAMDEWR